MLSFTVIVFLRNLQTAENEQIFQLVERLLGIPVKNREDPTVARRLRVGMIWSGLHFGESPCNETLRNDSLWDDLHAHIPHACDGLDLLSCPVVSITGSLDVVWPPRLVEKWEDCTSAYSRHFVFSGVAHETLMNADLTKQSVFRELEHLVLLWSNKK